MLVTAAYHTYEARASQPACPENDQICWAKRWARVVNRYNFGDDKYKLNASGLNAVARLGAIGRYDAGKPGTP